LYGFPGFSSDSKVVAIPESHAVVLREVATGRRVGVFDMPSHAVTTSVLSPDGKWLATCTRNGETILWNARTGELVKTWKFANYCWDVYFCPKSRFLLLPSLDTTLVIHD